LFQMFPFFFAFLTPTSNMVAALIFVSRYLGMEQVGK